MGAKSSKRCVRFCLWLSEEEHETFAAQAKRLGLPVAQLIRLRLLAPAGMAATAT